MMVTFLANWPLLSPLRVGPFRRLLVGAGASAFADQILFVTLTLLALRVVGPGFALGAVLAVAAIPTAVLMPVGGWLSDHFAPERVLWLAGLGRTVLAIALTLLAAGVIPGTWPLYGLAALLGALNALYYPASLAAVPAVLGDKNLLGTGNAWVLGLQQASETVGPVVAAAIVAVAGVASAFGLNAALFAFAAGCFALVFSSPPRQQELTATAVGAAPPAATGTPFGEIIEGVRYALRDPVLRTMLIVLAALSFALSGPLRVGGALLAEARFGGAEAFGVLLSVFGGGSLMGLVLAGSAVSRGRRGRDLVLGVVALGIGLAAAGLVPHLVAAAALFAALGVGAGYLGVVLMAWLQECSDPGMRGRIMSLMMFAAVAVDPVSYALTGALGAWDVRLVFAAAGALLLLTALAGAANRTVRTLQ